MPTDAWRLAGLRTIGPSQAAMNARTSAGLWTCSERGLGMPASRVTVRVSALSLRIVAAPSVAPATP